MAQIPHLRFECLENDHLTPRPKVAALLSVAFEWMPKVVVLPANLRWLCWSGSTLIAHAAVQRRWFVIEDWPLEGWCLGNVCTHPDFQRRGIATRLLDKVHRDLEQWSLEFVVLNCGEHVQPFYEQLGYTIVSSGGLYVRRNIIEVDDDPALARKTRPDFDIGRLRCDAFPFVHDF